MFFDVFFQKKRKAYTQNRTKCPFTYTFFFYSSTDIQAFKSLARSLLYEYQKRYDYENKHIDSSYCNISNYPKPPGENNDSCTPHHSGKGTKREYSVALTLNQLIFGTNTFKVLMKHNCNFSLRTYPDGITRFRICF